MRDLVYLDCETTGLEPERHEVWEIAYAINDGAITSFQVPHSLQTADSEALSMNGYWSRANSAHYMSNQSADPTLRKILKDCTLVVANPTFDRMFLRARWGLEPWHYRSVDIETYAMAVFGWDRPKGMKDIQAKINAVGYDIPAPDHTAAGDVATMRAAYNALREIQNQATDWHRRTPFSFDPKFSGTTSE